MKPNSLILTILFAVCGFVVLVGCQEETASTPVEITPEWFQQFDHLLPPGQGQPKTVAVKGAPKITFDAIVHDFGDVGPTTTHLCEFRFTNTGTGILKIEEVKKACGCTPFELDKTEYAPGESGTLKVQYYSDTQIGPVTKNLTMLTNDATQPEIELAIAAKVVSMVDFEPKALSLLLVGENAGCPQITLSSIDNKPFSISYFRSIASCITADFDPAAVATSFVLNPQVDMAKLEQITNGSLEIGLTHPECKAVVLNINVLPRYRINPGGLSFRGVAPNIPFTKKVAIANNYNEDFNLESAWSTGGTVKVLSNIKTQEGYELDLQITPPATPKRSVLSETLFIRTKSGDQVSVPLTMFYAGARTPTASTTTESLEENGKCKICGPRVIDPETGKVTIHAEQ